VIIITLITDAMQSLVKLFVASRKDSQESPEDTQAKSRGTYLRQLIVAKN
jgi:hypothetical protein